MIYGSVSVALASFAFWNIIEYVILKMILDDRRLKSKENQEQIQHLLKYAHVLVSLVHSVVGFVGSVTVIYLHPFANIDVHERVFVTPEPTVWVPVACSVGYFAWDLLTCLRRRSRPLYDPIFSVHAAVCLVGFIIGLWPFAIHYIIRFLIFEGSTVLVNLRWMHLRHLRRCNRKIAQPDFLMSFLNTSLYLVFFVLRILYGSMTTMHFTSDILKTWKANGNFKVRLLCLLSSLLVAISTCMNYYWFACMTRMMLRMRRNLLKQKDL